MAQLTLPAAIELLKNAGVPAARIRDMQAVFELPTAQNMILQENTPEGIPTKRMKTIAFKMS